MVVADEDVEQKEFKASDLLKAAGLTYRQLSDWENRAGVLNTDRATTEGWRKFHLRGSLGALYLFLNCIANELKVSKQTLITWSKDLTHIIANLRAIEIEELQEKYFALREKRLELFGETIRKIQSELKTRDLTNVPTEKLHFLLLKYAEAVRKDSLETVFSTEELDWLGDLKQVSTWRA